MSDGSGDDDTERTRRVARLQDNPAGRVGFREGRTVWEWNTKTGEFDLDQTKVLVSRLDNPQLAMQDTGQHVDLHLQGRATGGPEGANASDVPPPAFTPYGDDKGDDKRSGRPPRNAGAQPRGEDADRQDGLSLDATWRGPAPDDAFMPYGDDDPVGRKRRR